MENTGGLDEKQFQTNVLSNQIIDQSCLQQINKRKVILAKKKQIQNPKMKAV